MDKEPSQQQATFSSQQPTISSQQPSGSWAAEGRPATPQDSTFHDSPYRSILDEDSDTTVRSIEPPKSKRTKGQRVKSSSTNVNDTMIGNLYHTITDKLLPSIEARRQQPHDYPYSSPVKFENPTNAGQRRVVYYLNSLVPSLEGLSMPLWHAFVRECNDIAEKYYNLNCGDVSVHTSHNRVGVIKRQDSDTEVLAKPLPSNDEAIVTAVVTGASVVPTRGGNTPTFLQGGVLSTRNWLTPNIVTTADFSPTLFMNMQQSNKKVVSPQHVEIVTESYVVTDILVDKHHKVSRVTSDLDKSHVFASDFVIGQTGDIPGITRIASCSESKAVTSHLQGKGSTALPYTRMCSSPFTTSTPYPGTPLTSVHSQSLPICHTQLSSIEGSQYALGTQSQCSQEIYSQPFTQEDNTEASQSLLWQGNN